MVSFYVNSSQITFPSVIAAGMQVELSDRILVHSGDNKTLLNISHYWSLDCLIALLFFSFPFYFFVCCLFLPLFPSLSPSISSLFLSRLKRQGILKAGNIMICSFWMSIRMWCVIPKLPPVKLFVGKLH